MSRVQVMLDPREALAIAEAVSFEGDPERELQANRVAIKLDVVARGYRRSVICDLDELTMICQFAHHSACRRETVADVDAVLEEFLI